MDKHNRRHLEISRIASIILIGVGLVAMIVGVFQGEAQIVFKKATLICLECIGLG